MSTFDELLCLVRSVTNQEGFVEIGVETVEVHGHINIHNIAVLQRSHIWYTVANGFVHGSANRFGESSVVHGRGISSFAHDKFVNSSACQSISFSFDLLVDFIRCHTDIGDSSG